MRNYELLFILMSTLSEEEIERSVENYSNLITSNGGEIFKSERWGQRRLAFESNRQTQGYYFLLLVNVEPSVLVELTRRCRLDAGMLKYMFTFIDEKRISEVKTEKTPEDI